jgi:hypothetical protein
MQDNHIITLISDFGYDDPFTGIVKGVMLNINPGLTIVDITHGIRPHDIREAAYAIGTSFSYFPANTIHVVVVDPGVGSARRPVLVSAGNHYFIGPDNGVFSSIYAMHPETFKVVHITSAHYFLSPVSQTFQARDIFAPIAAWFSRGLPMERFGDPVTDFQTIAMSAPVLSPDGTMLGEVIHIDRFGNAITNISRAEMTLLLNSTKAGSLKIVLRGHNVPFKAYYEQGDGDKLYFLINSAGCIEFFVNQGRAADTYHISLGEQVTLLPA